MERLVLFDIDCTLIDAHGAGGRAIVGAVREIYGVEGDLGGYTFHGRTDPGIIRDLAALWGAGDPEAIVGRYEGETQRQVVHDLAEQLGAPDGMIDALTGTCIERYVELLAGEVARRRRAAPRNRGAGDGAGRRPRAVVGLLTGNVREGARIKLLPTGLYPLFKVGAFGSDSAYRRSFPPVAVARAEQLTGRRFAGKEIVIIGDTPADVQCGAALGVKAIAVATGKHAAAELAAYAPDHLFADLGDWRAAYEAILA